MSNRKNTLPHPFSQGRVRSTYAAFAPTARRLIAGKLATPVALALLALSSCNKSKSEKQQAQQAVASVSAAPSAASMRPPVLDGPSANVPHSKWRVPSGPKLGILPGKGVGAIRFGANVNTIERLMGSVCDVKTEEVCRYVNQAIEFRFTDGLTTEIQIHRKDRPVEGAKGQTYGPFNGGLRRDVKFGMYRDVAAAGMGKAQRIEGVEANPNGTLERHYYPDIILEYDKLDNDNVVLGGMILRGKPPAAAVSATSPTPAAPAPAPTAPKPANP